MKSYSFMISTCIRLTELESTHATNYNVCDRNPVKEMKTEAAEQSFMVICFRIFVALMLYPLNDAIRNWEFLKLCGLWKKSSCPRDKKPGGKERTSYISALANES